MKTELKRMLGAMREGLTWMVRISMDEHMYFTTKKRAEKLYDEISKGSQEKADRMGLGWGEISRTLACGVMGQMPYRLTSTLNVEVFAEEDNLTGADLLVLAKVVKKFAK